MKDQLLLSPFLYPDFVPIFLGKSEPGSVLFGMSARCVTWGISTGRVPEVRLQKKFPQDTSRAALCLHLSLRQSISAAAGTRGTSIELSPGIPHSCSDLPHNWRLKRLSRLSNREIYLDQPNPLSPSTTISPNLGGSACSKVVQILNHRNISGKFLWLAGVVMLNLWL